MTTGEVQNEQPIPPPPGGAKRRTFAWRILAVVLILASMVGLAHFLRNIGQQEGRPGAASASKPGGESFQPTPPQKAPSREEAARQKQQDLRKAMGGLVMAAADEDGPYNDPANKNPEDRREFLAGIFGLPYDYPKNQVADDLAPKGAQVLIVFEDPAGQGRRIILMRVPGSIDEALSAIHHSYTAAGYQEPNRLEPSAQTDQGWLVRFTKGNRERLVYARSRDSSKETLIAVYDEPR
ncbi:MAG: hypothetical protein NT049_06360 [Planctomycetota bacterium]|nr:hypothetical protein [Planctomycetota bacterium]